MRKWLWIAPMLLLAAGCSKNQPPNPTAHAVGTAMAAEVSPPPPAANPEPVAAPDPAPPAAVVIPRGTPLRARLDQTISTRRNLRGDRFSATLVDPVMVDGQAIVPVGTRLHGHVVISKASGRLKGRGELLLTLDSFDLNGRRYDLGVTDATRVSGNHKRRNVIAIAGGAGTGASIGAIAAGGPGALIGAGAGAVAGTVGAAVTGKKQVTLPAESVVRFTLGTPVRV